MRSRIKKTPMAQINVVPYIDVMLVLLIIFMVTAPLVTQGIKVELPVTGSESIADDNKKPIIVSIKANGDLYLNINEQADQSLSQIELSRAVVLGLQKIPGSPVLVRGDKAVSHGLVTEIMALLKSAGIDKIGIVTQAQVRKKLK